MRALILLPAASLLLIAGCGGIKVSASPYPGYYYQTTPSVGYVARVCEQRSTELVCFDRWIPTY